MSSQPFALSTRVAAQWSAARIKAVDDPGNPGAVPRIYSQEGSRRLPDWAPVTKANLVLNIRPAHQSTDGLEKANRMASSAKAFVSEHSSIADAVDFYPGSELHCTIAYKGLIDLATYGVNLDEQFFDSRQSIEQIQSIARMERILARENRNLIRSFARAAKTVEPFELHFRGIQAVNNSILARALVGGAGVNTLAHAIRGVAPALNGGDPTVSPLQRNERGECGMAAHATLGIFTKEFPQEELSGLMHSPGRGVAVKESFQVSRLSLNLQAYADRADGTGQHFVHIAEIASFDLGSSSLNLS